jgi:hypothetical protein
VPVYFDQFTLYIVNANYSSVRTTEKLRVVNGVSLWILAGQQRAPKWKRVGD